MATVILNDPTTSAGSITATPVVAASTLFPNVILNDPTTSAGSITSNGYAAVGGEITPLYTPALMNAFPPHPGQVGYPVIE